MTRTREPGRAWSTFGFAVGVAASIAANVAHSYVAPASAPVGWSPQPGAIAAAAFWPIALVISIEVISRVAWPHRWYWALIRYVGLSAVALIAAVISYGHLSSLLRFYGEDRLSATIGPLAVDGLMVVCSGALLAIGDNVRRRHAAELEPVAESTVIPAPSAELIEAPAVVAKPPSAKPRKSTMTAQKVQAIARKMPDATPTAIAAKAGVSTDTARRYLRPAEPPTAASMNDATDVSLSPRESTHAEAF